MHPVSAYRPEVDGLRAVAVLSVLFFHASIPPFRGGFIGVDVFFVISGYLITRIILAEQDRGTFSLRAFYARRARRILPALMLVSAACIPPAVWLMTAAQLQDFARMLAAVGVAGSNVVLAATTGYFDAPAEDRPLLHTWSLAVEEQFYLVFPLAMMVLAQHSRRHRMAWFAAAASLSLACAEWGWRHATNANFFLPPGRVWELLAGCMAALAQHGRVSPGPCPLWLRQLLCAVGFAGIVVGVLGFDHGTPSPSAWLLAPVLGTVAILLWARPDTWVGRVLAWRPLVGIGLVSYSAYLWHQPLLAFWRIHSPGTLPPEIRCAILGLTFALAYPTWKYVEQPLRSMKVLPDRLALRWAAACTLGLLAVGSAGALFAQAIAPRVPASVLAAFKPPPRSAECFDIEHAHSNPTGWSCSLNPGAQARPSFALFGDSHANQVMDAFAVAAKGAGRSGVFAGFSGCAPLLGTYPLTRPDQGTKDCHAMNLRMVAHVREQGIRDVYLVAKWSYYTDPWNGGYLNALGLSRAERPSLEGSRRAFAEGFAQTVRAYASAGARVHVVEQVPQQLQPPDQVYSRAWQAPDTAAQVLMDASVPVDEHRRQQSFPAAVFRRTEPGLRWQLINFEDVLCSAGRCPIGTPAVSHYFDRSHLSADGARKLVPRLTESLRQQH